MYMEHVTAARCSVHFNDSYNKNKVVKIFALQQLAPNATCSANRRSSLFVNSPCSYHKSTIFPKRVFQPLALLNASNQHCSMCRVQFSCRRDGKACLIGTCSLQNLHCEDILAKHHRNGESEFVRGINWKKDSSFECVSVCVLLVCAPPDRVLRAFNIVGGRALTYLYWCSARR